MNKSYRIFIMMISICILFPIDLSHYFKSMNKKVLSGDSFGALNAIISGLAFCSIIYTILIQQNQLKMQRE